MCSPVLNSPDLTLQCLLKPQRSLLCRGKLQFRIPLFTFCLEQRATGSVWCAMKCWDFFFFSIHFSPLPLSIYDITESNFHLLMWNRSTVEKSVRKTRKYSIRCNWCFFLFIYVVTVIFFSSVWISNLKKIIYLKSKNQWMKNFYHLKINTVFDCLKNIFIILASIIVLFYGLIIYFILK